MTSRSRNLLFAGLVLIAFASAAYKVFSRAPSSVFVAPTTTSPSADISQAQASKVKSTPLDTTQTPRFEERFV